MSNLPAHLANRRHTHSNAAAVIASIPTGQPAHISIRQNRFTKVFADGETEPVTTLDAKTGIPYFDVVIVDELERPSRVYYADGYEEGSSAPPNCWSDNGVAPSQSASDPQHVTCNGCPQQVWGSATSRGSGKPIPACRHNQKLALVDPTDMETAFLLRVPPNSLKNLTEFLKKVKGQEGNIITRISFQQEPLGTLTFWPISYIDAATAEFCDKLLDAKATDEMVGRLDLPAGGALPAPAQRAQIAPAAANAQQVAAPAQAAQATPPAAAPEAPKRRGRPKAEAPGMGATAPFRPFPSPVQEGQAFAPGQTPSQTAGQPMAAQTFGIAQGAAPNPDLQKSIDEMFGPQ